MSRRPPRFLIVRLGSLGDVVHAIPAAAALRRQYPDAGIDWIVDPRYADLVRMVNGIDRAISFDPRGSWARLLGIASQLRGVKYHAAIDLQGLLKSAMLARAAGATHTLGFDRAHLREPLAGMLYTDTQDPGDVPHVIHKGLALMGALGVEDKTVTFPLTLKESSAAREVEAQLGSYAIINAGAAWPNKRWPPERFGALTSLIRDRRALRSVVLWGPGERDLGAAVVAASNGAAMIAPETSITDIAALAARASLMVSGDTGPLHIGAAVGAPIVAIFGPTRVARNGPWDPADISLSRYDTCVCHYERRCKRSNPCIDDISVDEVIAAIERRVAAR